MGITLRRRWSFARLHEAMAHASNVNAPLLSVLRARSEPLNYVHHSGRAGPEGQLRSSFSKKE